MLLKTPTSPKRIGARRDFDLYHYYAAFAQSFIEQQILELDLPSGSTILDPWCGSGTTLAAARRFGHQSFGFDINPVSVVLSKSRFATTDDADDVLGVIEEAVDRLSRMGQADKRPDVLLWTLRDIIFGCGGDCAWEADRYRSMPPRTALLLTGLFFFARRSTKVSRSKNPSWRKRQDLARLSMRELRDTLEKLTHALAIFKKSNALDSLDPSPQVELLNNESEGISSQPFADALITSPPYLTRLDYGVSTGLEWRLLKGDRAADLTGWRASFTGSVLTSRTPTSVYPLPRAVGDVLAAIQRHQSKAAGTYYFQFFRNYFVGIQNAIGNITQACKSGAAGLFVVQDSQFKEINIPLTGLFEEMLKARGWTIIKTEAFSILPTFYKVNSRRWSAEDFVRSENLIWAKRAI